MMDFFIFIFFICCSLIFGCIVMQRECKNESGIDISGRRILPVDYFGKTRGPTSTNSE